MRRAARQVGQSGTHPPTCRVQRVKVHHLLHPAPPQHRNDELRAIRGVVVQRRSRTAAGHCLCCACMHAIGKQACGQRVTHPPQALAALAGAVAVGGAVGGRVGRPKALTPVALTGWMEEEGRHWFEASPGRLQPPAWSVRCTDTRVRGVGLPGCCQSTWPECAGQSGSRPCSAPCITVTATAVVTQYRLHLEKLPRTHTGSRSTAPR